MAQLGGGRRRPIAMAAESANARYVDRRCARATRVLTGAGFTSLGTLRSGDRRGRFLDLGRWSASGEGRGEGGRAGFPLCHLGSADRHNPLRRASHRVRGPAQPALQSVSPVPNGDGSGWNSAGAARWRRRGRFGLCHGTSADRRRAGFGADLRRAGGGDGGYRSGLAREGRGWRPFSAPICTGTEGRRPLSAPICTGTEGVAEAGRGRRGMRRRRGSRVRAGVLGAWLGLTCRWGSSSMRLRGRVQLAPPAPAAWSLTGRKSPPSANLGLRPEHGEVSARGNLRKM